MISQAGIYKVDLYENKEFVPVYDSNGNILSFTSSGEEINLNTDYNDPKFSDELNPGENKDIVNAYKLGFHIDGISQDNFDQIELLQKSIYGWVSVIEFMDTQKYIILTPFFISVEQLDSNISHTFNIEMFSRVDTPVNIVEYTP